MENGLKSFFFDSYALIEIYSGNKNYEEYKQVKAVTSYFQVYEVYYNLRKIYSEEEIKDFFNFLKSICINLDFNWISKAVNLRFLHKNKDLSYADCLGYIASKELQIPFLTGDKEFKDFENVEFVK
ncbi:MAG: PIN domain-containing protein [Candidatus Pacearchaeota archaeon]|jgi:predicted nucleic acid-binding protein